MQNIGKCTYMVLMTVSDDKALYLVDIVLKICYIGNYQINTQHLVFRERQTAVHHNNTVFISEGSDIHSNLLKTSQWDNLQLGCIFNFLFTQIISSIIVLRTYRKSICKAYVQAHTAPTCIYQTHLFRYQGLYHPLLTACEKHLQQLPVPGHHPQSHKLLLHL